MWSMLICPSCERAMRPARFCCDACGVHLEGNFPFPVLCLLSPEEQDFVITFLQVSGNIREMERQYGVSYPTIKNRLNAIVRKLGYEAREEPIPSAMEILNALDAGEISVEEALKRLQGKQGGEIR